MALEDAHGRLLSEAEMRRDEWPADFCERLGLEPPSKEEVVALLDLAATATHSSERIAAPLAR
jgi:hypothetical protein